MKVLLRQKALDDLDAIRAWYVERNPAVARFILASVQARLMQLEDFPELVSPEYRRAERVLSVPGTPLVVVYKLDVNAEIVDVIAVIDGRRNPASRFRP